METEEQMRQVEVLQDLLNYALIACPIEGGISSKYEITEERVEELRDRAAGIIGGGGTEEERRILVDILNFSLEACPLSGIPSEREITIEEVEGLISLLQGGSELRP